MFEDQYEAAEQHLDYAFLHCHKHAFANKKFILRYLVPVKIYRGRLPSPKRMCKGRFGNETFFASRLTQSLAVAVCSVGKVFIDRVFAACRGDPKG